MSKIKHDLMKKIEAKVAKKKQLSKQVSRQKTIANWVAEFFTEYEKTKKLSEGVYSYQHFTSLTLSRLAFQLRTLDRRCTVDFKQLEDGSAPVVEIRWGTKFIQANNCEEVLVFDASAAFFQSAIEEI